jgi:predicted transcriptional regulator
MSKIQTVRVDEELKEKLDPLSWIKHQMQILLP